MLRFEVHSHTDRSNFRLVDCINKPKDLVDRALDLGLAGIAITDHETVATHQMLNIYEKEIQKTHPNFKIALGNEIYLCPTREKGQKYYHFILIAKNKDGQKALRELSSNAWLNSFHTGKMERVITLYSDIEEILEKYPNSLIATTACLGGQLSTLVSQLLDAEKVGDETEHYRLSNEINDFLSWCKELFRNDFYIECAPGCSKDQIRVNQRLVSLASAFNIPMVIGTDAHYLKKEDRYVHKAYLNSKEGEREVDAFYEYSYLQTNEEIFNHLKQSGYDDNFIAKMFDNSIAIWSKIENYNLGHSQTIPKVSVTNYEKCLTLSQKMSNMGFDILSELFMSDDKIERYWVNECYIALKRKGIKNREYLARLNEEADIKKTIGQKLHTNMFAYPVTLQHYVDMFWECGSTVGAGRGSSCSGLNHYLLGITQLDPLKWDLPFWRYLNKERIELGSL